jgi:hypothetical protein
LAGLLTFFESEEGQREFAKWKNDQEKEKSTCLCLPEGCIKQRDVIAVMASRFFIAASSGFSCGRQTSAKR